MHAADVDDGDTFGDGRGRRPDCGDLTDSVQFRAHSGGLAGTRAVGRVTAGDDERSAIALGLLGRPPPQTCPSPSLRS